MDRSSNEVRREIVAIYGVPALLLAFFLQPDIAAASIDTRAGLAGVAVATLIALETLFSFVEGRGWRGLCLAIILLSAGTIFDELLRPDKQSVHANDHRCLAIQHDMLSAHPRRSDSPDLFQALGCRPQGSGGVYAPPTARERIARRPLPSGGYPPPR